MLSQRYHLIAEGKDANCLKALGILEGAGLEYVLTLVDKSPDYFYYLKTQYSLNKLPLVFEYVGNSFTNFRLIGGLEEFEEHIAELFK